MNSDSARTNIERDNRHEMLAKAILKRNAKCNCLYPSCTKKSIFSHAISKSISLVTIAETGHLSTIESRREKDVKSLRFGTIGIHDATGFNGFCTTHDALFSSIDNEIISDTNSLLLQAYRSVVSQSIIESRLVALRHANFKEVDIEKTLDMHLEEHPWLREQQGRDIFIAEYAKVIEAQRRRAKNVMQLPSKLLEKLAIMEKRSLDDISVVSTELLSHYIVFRRLSFKIPVALNCILPTLAGDTLLDFYFAVIPYEQSTLVMGIVPKSTEQWLLDKLMQSFSSDIAALDFVESVMACNNDWYMTPSVLDEMPTEKREVFLSDSTFINERRFYEGYDVTLFDSLRRELAQQHPEFEAQLRLDMIGVVPSRESYEVRYEKMMDALVSQPVKLREL